MNKVKGRALYRQMNSNQFIVSFLEKITKEDDVDDEGLLHEAWYFDINTPAEACVSQFNGRCSYFNTTPGLL